MFKNLKVGAKIRLGFGIILLLIIILATGLTISNVSSIGRINKSSNISQFQTIGVALQNAYNDARIGSSAIYISINDSEYQRVTDSFTKMEEYFNEMIKMSDEIKALGEYKQHIEEIKINTEAWIAEVKAIQNYRVLMNGIREENRQYGPYLAENASVAVTEQKRLINQAIATSNMVNIQDKMEMLDLAGKIEIGIYDTRRLATIITEGFNTDYFGDFKKIVEETKENFNNFIEKTTQQDAKDAMTELAWYYKNYTDCVNRFSSGCFSCEERVVDAVKLGAVATDSVFDLTLELDNAMEQNFSSTVKFSTIALFVIIAVTIGSIVISAFVSIIIIRSITNPLEKMNNITSIVASTGRMKFNPTEIEEAKSAVSNDEIGQTVSSFIKMLDRQVFIAGELEKLAEGDLTIDINPVSHDDTMANALRHTVDKLNDLFGDINTAANQVSAGSKQIAEGAQALASGSTEQASSIEELSASIIEIASAIRDNADKAGMAAKLSENIKTDAQEGEVEMENMMSAVKEINESSQNISKVIKVIDDIAFQTNILALNAAVEAARAGAAGKGFAVVADEVRNLASKSAEAANNTSAMISNSIEKAELGSKIANETSKSLARIVSGILESTEIIKDISVSSDEQSIRIDQINIGISQVSDVVQLNSSTAEESAASSEEMNRQTVLLEELISRFKLKDF